MPNMTVSVGMWFIGATLTLISFILAIYYSDRDEQTSVSNSLVAMSIGIVCLAFAAGYDLYGNGWRSPPREGKYLLLCPEQGEFVLVPKQTPRSTPVYHRLEKRAITFVQVEPQDKQAYTMVVVGSRTRKVTVYLPNPTIQPTKASSTSPSKK